LQERRKGCFWYRHFCVSVIMRPSGYLMGPYMTLRAIWVWDPKGKNENLSSHNNSSICKCCIL